MNQPGKQSMKIPDDIVFFLEKQGFLIVATIDENGYPHTSCKGLVEIREDKIILMDLYRGHTYRNLLKNPFLSATSVDEHLYKGYCLKGGGRLVKKDEMKEFHLENWRDRKVDRTATRVIKNIRGEKGHGAHPEADFPEPKHLIVLQVEEIVDLAQHTRKK